jgi:hypothetical protein
MSLDFDLSQIADREKKQETNGFCDGLIWATIYTGIARIKEENVVDFYSRLRLYDRCIGHVWSDQHDNDGNLVHQFPTLEQVRDFIGLKTNATPMTLAGFLVNMKKMMHNSYNDILYDVNKKNKNLLFNEQAKRAGV